MLERLKARATAQRKSLEQSLRDLLTEAAKPSRAELLAELERIRAMTPPRKPGMTYPDSRRPGRAVSLVVDASVALKWFLSEEPHGEQALAIVQDGATLIAPDFLIAEVCNAAMLPGARQGARHLMAAAGN